MPRYNLMVYTGAIKEYKPYKRRRRHLVDYIGITGVDLAIIICFIVSVTLFIIALIRWWNV